MLEWLKYTSACLKRNMNFCILLFLIAIAVLLYEFFSVKLELIALIFSPLFTITILPMIEESKSKWITKYETFKLLYAYRNNLVSYDAVRHLNLIDIVFINDKKVRSCWKELRQILNTNPLPNNSIIDAKCAELLAAMASVLGVDRDMNFSDIISAYYPQGLANIDTIFDKKSNLELEFYTKACAYIDKLNSEFQNKNV